MDCNKDEAIRAKEIAEQKLLEKDWNGAKKFALKAQNLFPKLDGLSRLLDIININAGYENKINGEPDYYAILGVEPFTNKNTMKAKYRKMALALHPDKTSLDGAEGAFKILSLAWSVMSDDDNRNAYNFRRILYQPMYSNSASSSSASRAASASNTHPAQATFFGANTQPVHTQQRNQWTANSQQGNAQYAPNYFGDRIFQQPPGMRAAAGSQYSTSLPNYFRHPTYFDTASKTTAANMHNSSMNPKFQKNPEQGSRGMKMNSTASVPSETKSRRQKKPSAKGNTAAPNQRGPSRRRPEPKASTFWAHCKICNIYFEYNRIYLNQNLLCTECQKAFFAKEVELPEKGWLTPLTQQHKEGNLSSFKTTPAADAATSNGNSTPPQADKVEGASVRNAATSDLNRAKKRKQVDGPKSDGSKAGLKGDAGNGEGAVDSALNKDKPKRKRRVDGQKNNNSKDGIAGNAEKVEEGMSGGLSTEKPVKSAEIHGQIGGSSKNKSGHKKKTEKAKGDSNVKDLSQTELRAMLIKKAKMEISGHLKQWETEKRDKEEQKKHHVNDSSHPKARSQPKKSSTLKETDVVDAITDETVSMDVPDANFHNFDEDRVENSFSENQVWAAYDSADGMPRLYALVQHVVSRNPFKLEISWLDAKSTSEFGSLDWIGSGFTKTIGDFKLAKSVLIKRLNSFSHVVKWRKGARGLVQIFPAKGDVWALYKNWSPDWNEMTADDVIRKYEMVEVLEDYSISDGILVAPLVKVSGFTTVFSQIPKQILTWKIAKDEMFRFSHQVPFFKLQELEDKNVPDGCYELDPAALPLDLLKVITEAEAAEAAEERVFEHLAMLRKRGAEGGSAEPVVYHRRNKCRKTEGSVDQSDGQTSQDEY